MNSERWGTFPARIFNARTEAKALPLPGAGEGPQTIDDGYAFQKALIEAWGEPISGWKIGATAAPVQARFGTDRPFSGPFYKTNTFRSPARLFRQKLQHTKIESEFAFRFMRRLEPRSKTYQREEVIDAIDALIPAIEVVSPRFLEVPFGNAPLAIADWGVNGAVVLGAPVVDGWDPDTVRDHRVRLVVDGTEVAAGEGRIVLGDPLAALTWLVEHLSGRGIALSPGDVVLTGTTTGIFDMTGREHAVADFGDLGSVEATFV
ncbi:MAG TPA: fumarylacetoacetate hydrolase family protein [Hyphomicrobiaceae bacterium]|nr:fumarylacetoacetate hydrolase family protein [Hyphomicrobiaceae bacterium]